MKQHIPYGKQTIGDDDIEAVSRAMIQDLITTGPTALKFEQKFAEYTNSEYAVAVSNGTAALHLSSLVLLKKDDKVLTTPNSFLATSNSILFAGAEPLFVDIQENGNIDLNLCEEIVKKDRSVKALYGVHFSGNPLDTAMLKKLKEKYGLIILEDCSHSIGGVYESGEKIGSCISSDCSTFSFHPVKNITMGEGGVITTNSENIYKHILKLCNHGMTRDENLFENRDMVYDSKGNLNTWYYEMKELGFNYRITDIQCALGLSQLKKLDKFVQKRHKIALNYDVAFSNCKNIDPLYLFNSNSSYHLYVVRIKFDKIKISRSEFFAKVRKNNIGLMVHYIPINKQPYYRKLGYGSECTPEMDKYYEECVTLPMYPKLSLTEQNYVVKTIIENLNE